MSIRKIAEKRFIQTVIVVIGIGLIISLSRNIYRLLKADDQIELAQEHLEELEREHQELVQKREYYQSEEFVEKEARNKLNMSKPDEIVVILPPNLGQTEERKEFNSTVKTPNWQRWLKLFF